MGSVAVKAGVLLSSWKNSTTKQLIYHDNISLSIVFISIFDLGRFIKVGCRTCNTYDPVCLGTSRRDCNKLFLCVFSLPGLFVPTRAGIYLPFHESYILVPCSAQERMVLSVHSRLCVVAV